MEMPGLEDLPEVLIGWLTRATLFPIPSDDGNADFTEFQKVLP